MIIRPARNQVTRQFALREQGIGCDGASADIDRIEQGGGGFYLVGAFFLIAPVGAQRADFFWA